MQFSTCNALTRNKRGSAAVELAMVVVILVPIALLAVNLCALCFGGFVDDEACREAARAAATQASSEPSEQAADAAIKSFALPLGAFLSSPQIVGFNYLSPTDASDPDNPKPITVDALTKDDLNASPPNIPYVQVFSQLNATTPAPMLIGTNGLTGSVTLGNYCSFPLLGALDDNPDDNEDSGDDDPPLNGATASSHSFADSSDLNPDGEVLDPY